MNEIDDELAAMLQLKPQTIANLAELEAVPGGTLIEMEDGRVVEVFPPADFAGPPWRILSLRGTLIRYDDLTALDFPMTIIRSVIR
jgi:hypothetical protein